MARLIGTISTDGCTFCPDKLTIREGWWFKRVSIVPCCVIHDQQYGLGGTEADRLKADQELYDCILKKTGGQRRTTAKAIYNTVRKLGASHFKLANPPVELGGTKKV